MTALKHLGRYVKGAPQAAIQFHQQDVPTTISVHVDTDFAACLRTRKSATGFTARLGGHLVHHCSNLQST
eukprot:4409284-Amphidinium_carterae.1